MYFDFEDYRPDITPVGRAISWREGVLLSIIVHLVGTIVVLVVPRWLPFDADAARARQLALAQREQEPRDKPRFVFVQPRVDRPAPKPPDRGEASAEDRQAQASDSSRADRSAKRSDRTRATCRKINSRTQRRPVRSARRSS